MYEVSPKIPEIWRSRGNQFQYGLVVLGSAAYILREPAQDVALHWQHAFCWSRRFYNVMIVLFGYIFVEMVDMKKQCFCIKFCFKLGQSAAKLTKCLRKHLVMTFWVKSKPLTGLTRLKRQNVSWRWRTFWTIFNWHNAGKCCKRVWGNPQGP